MVFPVLCVLEIHYEHRSHCAVGRNAVVFVTRTVLLKRNDSPTLAPPAFAGTCLRRRALLACAHEH